MRQTQTFLLVIALTVAVTAVVTHSQGQRPNFSGFWELDKARSKISLRTQASTSVAQVIEHREPKLKITRIISGDQGKQMLPLELTTDNRESLDTVDGHQLSFRARWKGSRLVVEVIPPGQGRKVVIEEVWFLSQDGKTLTVELHLRGSKRQKPEKLVYIAKAS